MENNLNGSDEISGLPDALLTHILSFLNPREAIQTCLLSKRWRTTWTSVPVLRFDYKELVPYFMEEWQDENQVKFVKFVKGVMQNRERLSLDTFEFLFNVWNKHLCNHADLLSTECILLGLELKPRVFSVCASMQAIWGCSEQIFTCSSLQSVTLNIKSVCDIFDEFLEPRAISLPHLKILKLDSARVNDNFFNMLFSSCPVLEELQLCFCCLHVSLVSSETLMSLVLKHCNIEKKLVISSPNLVHLDIDNGTCDTNISLQNMASLVDARIQCSYLYVNDTLESSNRGLNVHKVTGVEATNCSDFKILKSLQIRCSDLRILFNSITFFLKKSPNIKKLSLEVPQQLHEMSTEEEWRYARSSYVECADALLNREYLELVLITDLRSTTEERFRKLVDELYLLAKLRKIRFIVFVRCTSNYYYLRNRF
ncbi:F-box family protein [Rhynchospora pubera]|uniref:F-box family protein n=1 Tax=Rhynchospora pubera TaxID=906938 RepID=A0AAV8AR90_9POAL|nr:F-box family protein [Rhynchospora pubera]